MNEQSNLESFHYNGVIYDGISIGSYIGIIRGSNKIIEKIKKESPDRINVKLRQWVQTGLASLAHIKYDKQLEFKRNQVVNLLHKA
uniref:hypothetical protein n=1 Tax=Bacteroides acidifaciens TaxID=85831 RepID=UPI00258DFCC7